MATPQSVLLDRLAHRAWNALDGAGREETVRAVADLAPELDAAGVVETSGGPIGVLVHRELGIRLHLIPGGLYRMGLLDEESGLPARASRPIPRGRMGPVREVDVAPLLLAAEPLAPEALARLLAPDVHAPDVQGVSIGERRAGAISHRQIAPAIEALSRAGLRLPSEAEWEYACRAGSSTPFPAGLADIPRDPFLPSGGFGLVGMGAAAELCADPWRASLARARADARAAKGRAPGVVRGGAATTYPWQGTDEWVELLCAWRRPLADRDSVSIRPARAVFADEIAYAPEAVAARARDGLVMRELVAFSVERPDPGWPLAVAPAEARRFAGPWDQMAGNAWHIPHLLARLASAAGDADPLLDAVLSAAGDAGAAGENAALDALVPHARALLDGPARRTAAARFLRLARTGHRLGELAGEAQRALLTSSDEADLLAAAEILRPAPDLDQLVGAATARAADPVVRAALMWGLSKVDAPAAADRAEPLLADQALWLRAAAALAIDAAERRAPAPAIAALQEAVRSRPADPRWRFTSLDQLAAHALRRLEQRAVEPVQLEAEAIDPGLLRQLLDADEQPLPGEQIVERLAAALPRERVLPAVLGLVHGATVDGASGPVSIVVGGRAVLAAACGLDDPAGWARAHAVDPAHAPPPVAWAIASILLATGCSEHELRARLPLLVSATLASPPSDAESLFGELPAGLRPGVLRARVELLKQVKSSIGLLARAPDPDLLCWMVARLALEPRWGAKPDDLRRALQAIGPAAGRALAALDAG